MVTFAVDPALLGPHVPGGTTLDPHDGAVHLSFLAFEFKETRLLGLPIPGHRDFEEMNLRFYVRREESGEIRHGVVFLREYAPRIAVALGARLLYNEPYNSLPMRHAHPAPPVRIEYGWRVDGSWQDIAANAQGRGAIPPEGSHEDFIARKYWGYTRQRDGGTLEYRVDHPPWRVWHGSLAGMPAWEPLYGRHFAAAMIRPVSVLLADGSRVAVHRGVRLDRT